MVIYSIKSIKVKIYTICIHKHIHFQFKSILLIYSVFILRYKYEFHKEISNIEWKDHSGLRTVKPRSFFIRYRNMFVNEFLMFVLQFIIIVIISSVQIIMRLVPSIESQTAEQIFILFFLWIDMTFIIWLFKNFGLKSYDRFYLHNEIKRKVIICIISLFIYTLSFIIWITTNNNIDYIW